MGDNNVNHTSLRLRLRGCVNHTALMRSDFLSRMYNADVMLKREDLQVVRSYKLRGAYNKIMTLSDEQLRELCVPVQVITLRSCLFV